MTLKKINTRNIVIISMIVVAMAFRLLSFNHKELSSFNPVWAIALFGGVYFTDRWKAYLVPLITMFLSDFVINCLLTSNGISAFRSSIWVYVSFIIMVFIGSLIKNARPLNVTLAALASVCVHWLLTDLPGALYPHTIAGYATSLYNAIPFEKNMLYSEVVFCVILFGGFELAKSKYTILRSKRELAV
jgi:hypothetical protein